MNPDNLLEACETFELFFGELRESHVDAVASGNEFAVVAISSLIDKAFHFQDRLEGVKLAAVHTAANAKKGKSE